MLNQKENMVICLNKLCSLFLKNCIIKLISDFSDIEDENLEIVNEKILLSLGLKVDNIKNNEMSYMKISNNIEQIIFENQSKLNIKSNKILQFIEKPLINEIDEENSSSSLKGKNNENSLNNKKADFSFDSRTKQDYKNLLN